MCINNNESMMEIKLQGGYNHKFVIKKDKNGVEYVCHTFNYIDYNYEHLVEHSFYLNDILVKFERNEFSQIAKAKVNFNSKIEEDIILKMTPTKEIKKEMTIDEIEKQLGYKIKIVNKDKGDINDI